MVRELKRKIHTTYAHMIPPLQQYLYSHSKRGGERGGEREGERERRGEGERGEGREKERERERGKRERGGEGEREREGERGRERMGEGGRWIFTCIGLSLVPDGTLYCHVEEGEYHGIPQH